MESAASYRVPVFATGWEVLRSGAQSGSSVGDGVSLGGLLQGLGVGEGSARVSPNPRGNVASAAASISAASVKNRYFQCKSFFIFINLLYHEAAHAAK